MKRTIFVVVFIFCLLTVSYGYEKFPQHANSILITRDFQMKEFNLMEAFDFWTNTNSFWFTETATESCSIKDNYGSCSVSCDKGKAMCRPGYRVVEERNIYGGVARYTDHPPSCYCAGR